jgi:acetyl-CoA carboxylase carboxyltransferase component|tara:strand:+ start:1075 stop:2901 length:1827 start_codon:yes stop_codon:yes gene_type:complete
VSSNLQSPLQGTVLIVDVEVGDEIAEGQRVALLESMKMEHEVLATMGGEVTRVFIEIGQTVEQSEVLLSYIEKEVESGKEKGVQDIDLNYIRPDLEEVFERHEIGQDHAREHAVRKRHDKGQRTARENISDLTDNSDLLEYGPLVIAPQRKRRSVEDLILNTPADGMVGGLSEVNSELFHESKTQCVVISYDYTVLAGTQGGQNHRKKDRLFEIAKKWKLPVIFFTEGGGGRPGDTDGVQVAGLDCLAFGLWAELSAEVPLIGIASGYCFAGNAAILGCCDVIIATENANIGMGGPAMIEGGGLGTYDPSEIGPSDIQKTNGVVDICVQDELEAVQVAKKYLSYFQGEISDWDAQDQRILRHLVPENRLRSYDIRKVIEVLFDTDSVLELREHFGTGIITSLARVEGKPVGVIANNPSHLGGAIDADAADKAARFMQVCDAYDLPIISLCDTPGFMVGPEAEKTALVRHVSRMFVNARSVSVPTGTIVLRKAYGLGAQAMASGGFKFPMFTISWPTGEFGGMGLEGAVKLGYKKDLEAIDNPEEREEKYQKLVARMYDAGRGLSMADHFEIDDVIDPQNSRQWITTALRAAGQATKRTGKKRPMIDTW